MWDILGEVKAYYLSTRGGSEELSMVLVDALPTIVPPTKKLQTSHNGTEAITIADASTQLPETARLHQ